MDTQEVKKLNNNLKILQKNQKESKKQICNHCKLYFDSNESLEKHKWSKHPQNDYEYVWSQIKYEDRSKYSLAYLDDPYY